LLKENLFEKIIIGFMKKKLQTLSVLVVALLISSCASMDGRVGNHVAQDGWAGVYRGTVPAADGPGIDVILILRSTGTYILIYNYVDKGGEDFIFTGRLTRNAATNIITLVIDNFPPYYEAGRGILTQLDLAGRRITGELAGNYILTKISH
jgi:uncharacterized lipoprotein NlpE involved in copper resistance